jgi:hypothetical protein
MTSKGLTIPFMMPADELRRRIGARSSMLAGADGAFRNRDPTRARRAG